MVDERDRKSVPFGLITTPASYYSTPKARYLGERYKDNLDRLVEQIIRNPKTANLQFANNIASVGGIGFFTHSAVLSPDERYLEVILATPESFETRGDFNAKLDRIFSLYATELLAILTGDAAIYQEKEVSGYALNLSWRNIVVDARGPRVALERAIVYLPKENVRGFLAHQVTRNDLLAQGAIFAMEDDRAPTLVSFRATEPRQDFRPPIREESLAVAKLTPDHKAETLAHAPASQAAPAPPPPVTDGQEAGLEVVGRARDLQAETETREVQPGHGKPAPAEIEEKDPALHGAEESGLAALPTPSQPTSLEHAVVGANQESSASVPRQELNGQSENTTVEATERRPEASPRGQTEIEVEPESPGLAITVGEQSVAEVRPLVSSMSEAKPAEHAEPKDSASSAQSDIDQGDINLNAERPLEPQDGPERMAISEAAPAADSTSTEQSDGEPRHLPVDLAAQPVETAAPTPHVGEVAQETPRTGETTPPVQPVVAIAPQEPSRVTEPVPLPRVPQVASHETRRPSEPISVPPQAQVAPPEMLPTAQPLSNPAAAQIAPQESRPAVEPNLVPPVAQIAPQETPQASERGPLDLAAAEEKTSSSDTHEQLALLRTPPSDPATEKKPLARPVPKPLEGFVIQVGFSERAKAQHWAESMQRRGYAVSVTEAGAGSVRVRVGNFGVRDEAERQLLSFRSDGLTGIIINLPQAFRPQALESKSEQP